MPYLLDANVLITASNSYYRIDAVPEFWDWIEHQAHEGSIKIPREIMDEIKAGRDDDALLQWIHGQGVEEALLLDEDPDPTLVRTVVSTGYANDLTDDEIEQLGRDPFLIAYGLVDPATRTIVTTEVSKPSKLRHNRMIPDVCNELQVPCENPFAVYRSLNFHTRWNR